MPSVKEKNLVRRDAFSGYDGCRPKFGRMAISSFVHLLMSRASMSVLSREERVAECKEEKLSEEGRIFWL